MSCKINKEQSLINQIVEDLHNYELNTVEELYIEKHYYDEIDDKITRDFLIIYLSNRNIQIKISDNMIKQVKDKIIEIMNDF